MNKIANVENVVCSAETLSQHRELYHYTSAGAFDGILGSRTLWCSHYRDMTDRDNKDLNEIRLMRDILPGAVAPEMERIVGELNFNRHKRRLWKASGGGEKVAQDLINALYGATFDGQASYASLAAYLFSFSTHAADTDFDREHGIASQWNTYAGPEGYCCVFDTHALAQMLGQEMDRRYWVRLSLDSVRYANRAIGELFPELVGASAGTLRQFIDGVRYPEMAVPEFLSGATLLKNPDYITEREVRIVAIPGTAKSAAIAAKEYPKEFDPNQPLPVERKRPDGKRYIAMFDGFNEKLPVRRVIVGPGGGQQERADKARALLGDIEITLSRCTLS